MVRVIWFDNASYKGKKIYGFYNPIKKTIYIFKYLFTINKIYALLHEYCHHIIFSLGKWDNPVVAFLTKKLETIDWYIWN